MKRQVRKSVFETNSSSTHAMAIQSSPNVMFGIYTNMTDEEIDKYNADDEVKNGWRCKIIHKRDLPAIVTFHEGEFIVDTLKKILDIAIKFALFELICIMNFQSINI